MSVFWGAYIIIGSFLEAVLLKCDLCYVDKTGRHLVVYKTYCLLI